VRSDRPTSLPLPQRLTPIWLSSLIFLKRSSDVVTFLLVAATLTVYSWTVYTQQQWAQEYRKLETLQRNERHLTMANEGIKDQLAQQAEKPATGLVTPSQANTIFLPPAPQRQSSTTSTNTTDPEPAAKTPLGY
jgi:Fe-S cluster biosynthesis and repair protein YggX